MLDDATTPPAGPEPRCMWCSAILPSNHETTCPSCGATLVGEGDTSVPGLTASHTHRVGPSSTIISIHWRLRRVQLCAGPMANV